MCMKHRWNTAEGGRIHAHQEKEKTSSGRADGGQRTWVGRRMTPFTLRVSLNQTPNFPQPPDAKRVHENNLELIRNKSKEALNLNPSTVRRNLCFQKMQFPTHTT